MTDDVATECRKAGGDPDFCSHMAGLAKEFKLNWDSSIDRNTYPKIVDAYERYTDRRYGGENLHAGGQVYFSQFAKSALKHWR